jgi:hypothetical protein
MSKISQYPEATTLTDVMFLGNQAGVTKQIPATLMPMLDGSDMAWINQYKTGTTTTQVVAQSSDYVPLSSTMFATEIRQNIVTSASTGIILLPTKGNYLMTFDADIKADQAIELLTAAFYCGTVNGVPDQMISGVFPSVTFTDIETVGKTRHIGFNCILNIPADTPTVIVTGIKICVNHNYAGNVTLTVKKATKLTLLYLGV